MFFTSLSKVLEFEKPLTNANSANYVVVKCMLLCRAGRLLLHWAKFNDQAVGTI